jgi:hypothetical protein
MKEVLVVFLAVLALPHERWARVIRASGVKAE